MFKKICKFFLFFVQNLLFLWFPVLFLTLFFPMLIVSMLDWFSLTLFFIPLLYVVVLFSSSFREPLFGSEDNNDPGNIEAFRHIFGGICYLVAFIFLLFIFDFLKMIQSPITLIVILSIYIGNELLFFLTICLCRNNYGDLKPNFIISSLLRIISASIQLFMCLTLLNVITLPLGLLYFFVVFTVILTVLTTFINPGYRFLKNNVTDVMKECIIKSDNTSAFDNEEEKEIQNEHKFNNTLSQRQERENFLASKINDQTKRELGKNIIGQIEQTNLFGRCNGKQIKAILESLASCISQWGHVHDINWATEHVTNLLKPIIENDALVGDNLTVTLCNALEFVTPGGDSSSNGLGNSQLGDFGKQLTTIINLYTGWSKDTENRKAQYEIFKYLKECTCSTTKNFPAIILDNTEFSNCIKDWGDKQSNFNADDFVEIIKKIGTISNDNSPP